MIDLRSLVGMTEGAKKRAARRTANRQQGLHDTWTCNDWLGHYTEARKLYRVGERLRPCYYCAGPGNALAALVGTCADAVIVDGTRIAGLCDGSGVIVKPKMRRCEGCEKCSPAIQRALEWASRYGGEYDGVDVDGPCDGRGQIMIIKAKS